MEADVMVSNQYNQFCVSGVPEHPVEAAHVVLPVLQGDMKRHRGGEVEFSTSVR